MVGEHSAATAGWCNGESSRGSTPAVVVVTMLLTSVTSGVTEGAVPLVLAEARVYFYALASVPTRKWDT